MPAAAGVVVLASLTAGLWVANRERRIAERRFTDVRQLANRLFDIDVQVAQLQGGSKTRQLIVDTALEYLKRVSADVRMEPALALELGTAYMRVARVQGVNISPNLGQTVQADRNAEKAQELIASVLGSEPRNRTAILRAGQIAHDRMILASDAGHSGEELRFARTAVEHFNQYLSLGPLNASSDRLDAQQVIIGLINAANHYMRADKFDDALAIAGRAIDIAHATNWPTQAGAALMIVAMSHRERGELDSALQAIQESVRVLKPEEGETRTGRVQPYGLALIREGQILGEDQAISLNRPEEAIARIQLALRLGEPFARRDPTDFQSQYRIFYSATKLAAIVRHKDPARAVELYDDALRRIAGAKDNGSTLRNQTGALAASVYPLLQLGRRAEARRRLDQALDLLARQKQYPAAQVELDSPADDTLRALAEYEASRGNLARGIERYDELMRLILAAGPKPESRLEDAVSLSNLYSAAAHLHRRAGRSKSAAGLEERRRELWRRWDTRLPNNAFIRRQLEASRLPS